jgi:uncharacterized DUF497 family protein
MDDDDELQFCWDDSLLSVVYTAPEGDIYRIISARFATRSERDDYDQNLFHS